MAKQTFTQRYKQFRTRELLGEDGLFTIVADRIMQQIPGRYQVKATDVNKELDGLPRQSSKPFRFLQNGTDAGKKNSIFQNPLAVKGSNFLQ